MALSQEIINGLNRMNVAAQRAGLGDIIASIDGGDVTPSNPPTVADSTATDVAGIVSDFNGLLAALRTAGILAK